MNVVVWNRSRSSRGALLGFYAAQVHLSSGEGEVVHVLAGKLIDLSDAG